MAISESLQGFSDKAANFNPENIFDIFSGPGFAKVYVFMKIFFWFGVFVFVGIAIWKFILQYKVKITIKTRIGNGGVETKYDRAKIVVDAQNKRKLQLLKHKNGKQPLTCPIPAALYKGKYKKSDHYDLWLDDNYQLHPIANPNVDDEGEKLVAIKPQERDAWARFEDKAMREKYKKKDLMEKYLPAGILMISMVTAFLIWFFATKELGSGLTDLAQQFAQVASSCTSLGV